MSYSREALRALLEQAGLKGIEDTGNGFTAFCPFHLNTRTPAWGMNEDGLWNCFNPLCGESGNLFTFLVRVARMPAHAAIAYVPIADPTVEQVARRLPDYSKRAEANDDVPVLPETTLLDYARCPSYMLSRGFPKHFLREHEVGFDAEANRVTFAVRDHRDGALLGFTRRRVDNDEWPPYLHDFPKTRTLYGLHLVIPGQPLVITEGTTDALKARLYGRQKLDMLTLGSDAFTWTAMANAVATLGGGVSYEHAVELARLFADSPIVLGFDNDPPGVAATDRSICVLRKVGLVARAVLDFDADDLGALDRHTVRTLALLPVHRRHSRHVDRSDSDQGETEHDDGTW